MFASLFHMGQSRVCSLIITIKELQHLLNVHQISLIRLIWTDGRLEMKIPLKCSYRHQMYSYTSAHQQKFLSSVVLQYDKPSCSQKFVKWGHGLAPESLLCSLKPFEPVLLSMMQFFHLVALFSHFTFVLLSAEDAWLAEFNTLFFFH